MAQVRLIEERDAEQLTELYRAVYGETFPFKQFYDAEWIKQGVFDREIRWFVAENDDERILGSAAVMLNAGDMDDLISEIGRLVVHPDARGMGLGRSLVEAISEEAERQGDFAFGECRTAHVGAQKILTRMGYHVVGIEPLAYRLEDRESVVYVCRLSENARQLRKNNPQVVSEIYDLGAMALRNCGLEVDIGVASQTEPYPVAREDGSYELSPLDDRQIYRLLRLSRDHLLHPDIFGAFRLEYGYIKIKKHDARYLVLRRNGNIVGGLGYVWDDIDAKIRIFELVAVDDVARGTLLGRALAHLEETYEPEYIGIDVNAHAPRMQQTLELLGFAAVAYAPSMVYVFGERLDVIKMVKLGVAPKLDKWKLLESVEPFGDLVQSATLARARGVQIDDVMRQISLFDGLSDVQIGRIGEMSHELPFEAGEVVFREDSPGQGLYIVLEGSVEIVDEHEDRDDEHLATLGPGEVFGEMALVEQRERSAAAICAEPSRLLSIGPETFDALTHRDPELGMVVYRNIARALSERLRAAQ